MLVHNVLFWLKEGLDDDDRAAFTEGLESLREIESSQATFIGTPADTPDRPVIDTGYDYMLTVIFESLDDHDVYQAHPIHQAFVENHAAKWDRVVVRDAD